jgi:hypothetical protein
MRGGRTELGGGAREWDCEFLLVDDSNDQCSMRASA